MILDFHVINSGITGISDIITDQVLLVLVDECVLDEDVNDSHDHEVEYFIVIMVPPR